MNKHILIVDTNDESRNFFMGFFSNSDFDVTAKKNMEDAFSYLYKEHRNISAIMINNIQSFKNGLEILHIIHTNKLLSPIPLFLLLDEQNSNMQTDFLDLGLEYIFVKPYNIEYVKKCIESTINLCEISIIVEKGQDTLTIEEKLDTIMTNMNCGIIAATYKANKYEILFSNDSYYSIIGYTREEYMQISPSGLTVVSPKDIERVKDEYKKIEENKKYVLEYRIIRKDQKEVWIRHVINNMKIRRTGNIVQFSMIDDISAEKDAEKAIHETQEKVNLAFGLIEDSFASIYVCNAKTYEMLYLNRNMEKLCGKKLDSSCKQKCYEFFKGLNKPCYNCSAERVNENGFYEREEKFILPDKFYIKRGKIIEWGGIKARVEYMNDITDRIRAQARADESRDAIMIASEIGGVTFWQYDLDKKEQTWGDFRKSDEMGYPRVMKNVPESLIENGDVHKDDSKELMRMYNELFAGAESTTCTVRFYNHNNKKYVWHRVVYSRTKTNSRIAIGFAANVDLLQGIKTRYEKEHQLRDELMKNAIIYYENNLSTGYITEFYSVYKDVPSLKTNVKVNDKIREDILSQVSEEYREKVRNSLFTDALLESYNRGENSTEITYKRKIPSGDIHWVNAVVKIMKEPSTGDIIAFIYIHDVNNAEIDKIALSGVVADDVESLSIINVKTKKARLIKTDHDLSNITESKSFDHDEEMIKIIESRIDKGDRKKSKDFFSVDRLVSNLKKHPVTELSYSVVQKNGQVRWKRATAYYLDKSKSDIVLTRRDITVIYEEEQKQKLKLKAAADAANEANKAKGEFLSRMSHDMRTPMNAILGMVYLAKAENPSEQIADYLNNIDISSHFLLGLINDVLDLSKIESGNTSFREENYSIDEFVRGVNTVIKPLMDAKNINFTININCNMTHMKADKLRFNQVFYNLLTNAAKYTKNGGCVELNIKQGQCKGDVCVLNCSVKDNGIGMSEEFLKVIFTPFTQEHNAALAEQQGTGLGLAIVKSLVELNGGFIEVKSKLGEGTEFFFDINVHKVDMDEITKTKEIADYSVLNGMNILLVEDNEMNIKIAEKLLQMQGCIVKIARNGAEAVSEFNASNLGYFKAILMDVRMPVMNGIEATKKIRSLTRADATTVPIIAMTADAFTVDMDSTKNAGMNEHLTKPIDPNILFTTLVKFSSQKK